MARDKNGDILKPGDYVFRDGFPQLFKVTVVNGRSNVVIDTAYGSEQVKANFLRKAPL